VATWGGVEPPTFRFSGVWITVRRIPLTSVTCIAALTKDETTRARLARGYPFCAWRHGLPNRIRHRTYGTMRLAPTRSTNASLLLSVPSSWPPCSSRRRCQRWRLRHRSATPSGAVDSGDAKWTISGRGNGELAADIRCLPSAGRGKAEIGIPSRRRAGLTALWCRRDGIAALPGNLCIFALRLGSSRSETPHRHVFDRNSVASFA